MAPPNLAGPLKDALAKYQVEATAVMTLGPGRMVWDFYNGPLTIGIVPPATQSRSRVWLDRSRSSFTVAVTR